MSLRKKISHYIYNLPIFFKYLYEIFFIILAFIIVIFLFVELTTSPSPKIFNIFMIVDKYILIIFSLDYFTRLYLAEHKKKFIKGNVFDLLAIIPLDYAFRSFRLYQLVRLIRVISISEKAWRPFFYLLKTNGLHYVLLFTTILVILGSFGILLFEENITNFNDALWWSIVTATTVGYGDITPETVGGRIVAAILMFMGIGTIGMLTGTIATFFINKTKEEEASFTIDDGIKVMIVNQLMQLDKLSSQEKQRLKEVIVDFLDKKISDEQENNSND